MKLLITLLFTLSISISTFAGSKVKKYFELGTSLDWNKETRIADNGTDSKNSEKTLSNFTLKATKGYIFKERWDLSLGVQYKNLAKDQVLSMDGKDVKAYGVRVAIKYVFSKRPSLIKHYHKRWMTPYLGVAYQLSRLSPHGRLGPDGNLVSGIILKTEKPSYILSAGVRCFKTKNLAVTLDLSYIVGKQISTNKSDGKEMANVEFKEINPSLSFVYFY